MVHIHVRKRREEERGGGREREEEREETKGEKEKKEKAAYPAGREQGPWDEERRAGDDFEGLWCEIPRECWCLKSWRRR